MKELLVTILNIQQQFHYHIYFRKVFSQFANIYFPGYKKELRGINYCPTLPNGFQKIMCK